MIGYRLAVSSIVLLTAGTAAASTLSLSIEHQTAVDRSGVKPKLLRTVFVDEPIIATVELDVYAVPQLPSTSAHLEALRELPSKAWYEQLTWDIRDSSGTKVALAPRLRSTSFRERSPNAPRPQDRDTSVACSSYHGVFDLEGLVPGDYTIDVRIRGLISPRFPLAVRAGDEAEIRDIYLQGKARKTTDWSQFKALQLERLRLDPSKAAALLELAHRSLEFGTLEETTDYYGRAAITMEQNLREWSKRNPSDARLQAPAVQTSVKQIRSVLRVLPEYFSHRGTWRLTLDSKTGHYVITARDTNRLVRRIE